MNANLKVCMSVCQYSWIYFDLNSPTQNNKYFNSYYSYYSYFPLFYFLIQNLSFSLLTYISILKYFHSFPRKDTNNLLCGCSIKHEIFHPPNRLCYGERNSRRGWNTLTPYSCIIRMILSETCCNEEDGEYQLDYPHA